MNPRVNRKQQIQGAIYGLSAAALFGASTPISKSLLGSVHPVLLAGLLYLGAAGGLWLKRAVSPQSREAPIARADYGRLMGVVLAGGIAGPILMLLGLRHVTALSGSLLLNLESPFTMLLAVLLFREHLGRDAGIAASLIVLGAVALKLEPGGLQASTLGIALLAAACACWALDNNLTQRLSLCDPFAIVRIKSTIAGITNTALGLYVLKAQLPQAKIIASALVLGALSYGMSVVLITYSLRLVGAAREAAYFATAPFVGVLIAIIGFGESMHWYECVSMLAMSIGVVLLVRERHSHVHAHEALEHEHLHEHDEHHQHSHSALEPHSHVHRHEAMVHEHPHLSDLHHRHKH